MAFGADLNPDKRRSSCFWGSRFVAGLAAAEGRKGQGGEGEDLGSGGGHRAEKA